MFTTTLSLCVASITFIFLDRTSTKQSMMQELSVLGTVVSQRSAIALAFRDKKSVAENLNSLAAKESIELACVYDTAGELFSRYLNERNIVITSDFLCPTHNIGSQNIGFKDGFLETFVEIKYSDKLIGGLYLKTNTLVLKQHLYEYAKLSAITIIVILLLTFVLSSYLQRYISRPILSLSKLALKVKETNDFSLRSNKKSHDEVGILVDSFNSLLSMIEEAKARLDDVIISLKEKKEKSDANAISAEQNSKAISEFFAGASHDLRQPLHAMGIFSDALLDSDLSDPQHKLAKNLSLSIENMSSLFTDLLDQSRLDAELPKANIKEISLNNIFKKIKIDFIALATDKNLTLRIDQSNLNINSDPIMLERIIRNITSNAIRYTDSGEIHISSIIDNNNTIIKIADTGLGIPKEKQSVIFDSYTQIQNESNQGLGLGLSIVKKLSHALKVKIVLESDIGKGSCFSIIIPTKNKVLEKKESVKNKKIHVNQMPFSKLTFLVIDDETDILNAMDALLAQWGANVILAESIDQAIDELDKSGVSPALLITDYHLSDDTTGFDAISSIQDFLDEDIPSLIITGNTNKEDLILFSQHNQTVLHKPLKPAALRASISQILGV